MPNPQAKFEITADDKTAAAFRSAMTSAKKFEQDFTGVIKGSLAGISAYSFASGIAGAVELGEEMGNLAEATGLTAAAASEMSRVFQQAGLSNEQLANSVRTMQVELSNGGDAFKKWGVNVDELKGKAADDVFEILAQRISDIGDANQKAAAAADFFGSKVGTKLLPVLNLGTEGIQALRKELGGLSDDDVRELQEADDAMDRLGFLKQDFWNRAAIGVTRLAEAFGLLKQSPEDALLAQMDELTEVRTHLQKIYDSIPEDNPRFDQLRTNTKKKLDDNLAIMRFYNAQYQQMSANLGGDNGTDDPAKSTTSALSEVTLAAKRYGKTSLEMAQDSADAWADVNDTVLSGIGVFNELDDATQRSFDNLVDGLEVKVPEALENSMAEIQPWAEEMNRSMFAAFSDAFYNIGTGANSFADDVINAFKRVLANAATAQLFEMLAGAGKSMKANNDSGSFLGMVGGWLGGVFGGARAGGGPVSGGSAYLVGEQGPELFMPGSNGNIIPNHAMAGANITYAPVYQLSSNNMTQAQMLAWSKATTEHAVAKIRDLNARGRL